MALDIARLALDPNAPVDLHDAHWQPLVAEGNQSYFNALGWTQTGFGGLPAARFGIAS